MKDWFDFLTAQITQPLQNTNSICALSQAGILYVGGEDASEFLQNQLSNDISKTSDNHCQLSSASTSKGRMYGIFRVIRIDGGYLLLMPASIIDDVAQRLHKYILRARVAIADVSHSFAIFSLTFDDPNNIDPAILPAEINQVIQTDSLISIRLPAAPGRHRLLLLSNDSAEAIQLWQRFAQKLAVNDFDHWKLQELEAGYPSLYPATQEAFVLQMCNLDRLDGVNFKKGCYPGQEVVARTHYLGKLKRRMYLVELNTSVCPFPGDELVSRGSERADGSGKVVDSVQVEKKSCLALVSGVIDKIETNTLALLEQPEVGIELRSLPYTFSD